MKKISWNSILFSIITGCLFLVLALINLLATGSSVTINMFAIPALVGLLAGYLLGSTREKWLEKSRKVDKLGMELEARLGEVETQKSETKNLLQMVEKIPLPVYLKDSDHRYLLANEQYSILTGKPFDEIKGKTDHEIFPEPIADLFREQDLIVEKLGGAKTFEETIPLVDGIVTFETFKFPLTDKVGSIYAVGGICTDITKLKATEDSFNSQQDRLDVVLQHMSEAVVATDCDSRIVMFNRKAGELTECDPEIARGSSLDSVYKPKDVLTGADITFWTIKDGTKTPRETTNQEVILRTEMGRAQPVKQSTIILYDRFGQNMGLLIMFDSVEKNEKLGSLNEKSAQETASGSTDLSGAPQVNDGSTRPINILIMDDDPLIRKTCTLMLASKGYQTVLAVNGQEAFDRYAESLASDNPIQAVVMDLTVPGAMGGVEATTKILKLDPQARIIVASGYSNDPIMANFTDYGFLARVEKPFSIQKLISAVETLIGNTEF